MKKIFLLMFATVMILSGCQMPFTPPQNASKIEFIKNNVGVLAASNGIDDVLMKELKQANQKQIPFSQLINDINHTRKMQQNLYSRIDKDITPVDGDTRTIFLEMINQRIISYDALVEVISKGNYTSLDEGIKKQEINDKQLRKETLDNINVMLEKLKQKKLKQYKM